MSVEAPGGGFAGRFGLDPFLLLAQAVNFLVVLFVLRRFVFTPLLKTLRQRRATVEAGLREAAAATADRAAAAAERQRVLTDASAEASRQLRAVEEEANLLRGRISRTAQEEAEAMHDRAEREAEAIKIQAVAAAAQEVGDLAVDIAEKVLAGQMTAAGRARYRAAALSSLKKERA